MKKVKALALVIFIINTQARQAFSQPYAIEKVETYSKCSGNFKIRNDHVCYLSAEGNDITRMIIVSHNLSDNRKSIIVKSTTKPPLGWYDDNNVLFLKELNDHWYVSKCNVNTRQTEELLKVDSVYFKEECIAYDDSVFVIANLDFDNLNGNRVLMYDMNSSKFEVVNCLTGITVYRLAYNKRANCIAYSEFPKVNGYGKGQLQMVINKELITIEKFDEKMDATTTTFALSEDGKYLYYMSDSVGLAILKRYDIPGNKKESLYTFPRGIDCVDVSVSRNRIALTLENKNKEGDNSLFSVSKDGITMGFDCNRRMYILNLDKQIH